MAEDLLAMLRRQNEEKQNLAQMKAQGAKWQKLAETQQPVTIGSQQGGYGGIPAPEYVNYGGILQNAVSTFMANRSEKKVAEAQKRNDELSQQFMYDTLKDDAQGQKLLRGAQLGIPGFEEALAKHVAPQKEKIATLVQNARNFPKDMDDAAAAEIGKVYGVSAEMVKNTVNGAHKAFEEGEGLKHKNALELQGVEDAAAAARNAASNASREEAARIRAAKTGVGAGAGQSNFVEREDGTKDYVPYMTPGERAMLGKAKLAADAEMQSTSKQMAQFQPLMASVNETIKQGEQATQGLAQTMTESGVLGFTQLGEFMKNDATKQLEAYVKSEAILGMAALGGNDSNEELRKMESDLPKMYNDPVVLKRMLKRLNRIHKVANMVAAAKSRDGVSGALLKESKDYAKEAWAAVRAVESAEPEEAAPKKEGGGGGRRPLSELKKEAGL